MGCEHRNIEIIYYKEVDDTVWISHGVCEECLTNIIMPQKPVNKY